MSDTTKNNTYSDAVCVEAMRVFDSCSSQDCLEDLLVNVDADTQTLLNNASHVKIPCAEVIDASFNVDAVPFNKGFYSVDITYTYRLEMEITPCDEGAAAADAVGSARFNKKVILFGSEGNTKSFRSDETNAPVINGCSCCSTLPIASVSVVDPIVLGTKFICTPCQPVPPCGFDCNDGQGCQDEPPFDPANRQVRVTLGQFSVIKLERPVQVLVPMYDYCIPLKECSSNTDSPCEVFEKISFPTDEFFPKGLETDTEDNNSSSQC